MDDRVYGDIERTNHRPSDFRWSAYDPPLPTSILQFKSDKGKHKTQKPTSMINWILKYYIKEGHVILDLTTGSGSMGAACKEMNREFIGIEMDEEIYNSACERLVMEWYKYFYLVNKTQIL